MAFVSVAAIVFGRLGIDWSLVSVSAAAGAVAIVAGVARQLVRRRAARGPAPEPQFTAWTIGSLAVAALIIGVQLVIGFQRPDSISQTFDAFFHLNGIRYIVETGSASSFDLQGLVLPAGQTAFYPAGWHGVTSLVAASADVAIPAAVNAVNLVDRDARLAGRLHAAHALAAAEEQIGDRRGRGALRRVPRVPARGCSPSACSTPTSSRSRCCRSRSRWASRSARSERGAVAGSSSVRCCS